MKKYCCISIACFCSLLLCLVGASARPTGQHPQISEPEVEVDIVGDVDGTNPAPQKAQQDTIWIADWTFDAGGVCSEAGWTHVDNYIKNDGVARWHIESSFSTGTGMAGNSAALGYHDNVCCSDGDGYDNDWYQGIRMTYTGSATLSLDYIVDSEAVYDFLQIETDSLCLSYARVDFDRNPRERAAQFRRVEISADGVELNGEWVGQPLTNYGPGAHCVYISFFADFLASPCDGYVPTTVGEGAVVDNIVLVDGSGMRSENFDDGVLDLGTFLNMADSKPFGTWARLFQHITDNDICQENSTCAWLFTDDTTPTLSNDPSTAFGPEGYVIRNWLDDIVVSPWVSLTSTPTAIGTVLSFRRFPGNTFGTSRIVQNWSVRGKKNAGGTTCNIRAGGYEPESTSGWGHAHLWNTLGAFSWQSLVFDMSPHFDPTAEFIQIRFRTSDWQLLLNARPPAPFVPGPGPYTDRARIGRVTLSGPVIRGGLAHDGFPAEISPVVTPAGEHFQPTMDRFGSCDFSPGGDLMYWDPSSNLVKGDSITVKVQGIRSGGTIVTSVTFSGAIIAGPHQGKAPPPYAVGDNGFFTFDADSSRALWCPDPPCAMEPDTYFAELDDFYFRGGDVLVYFWLATDDGGGTASDPAGLAGPPASILAAQTATRGLYEVNFLPTIHWAPAYLARIAADPHGKIEPTAAELAASTQKNCILYVNDVTKARRSGDINRTSFMYALDRLGYRDSYDVYDLNSLQGLSHLGSMSTTPQCQGYNLIVHDSGNGGTLPDNTSKVDQATWYRNWLAQAPISAASFATLWMIGSNTCEAISSNALINTSMGVTLTAKDQGLNVNPAVDGVASFAFDSGTGQTAVDFESNRWTLNGGCPVVRNYDAIGTNGSAVQTHRYRSPTTGALGGGAIVMNRNPAENWNTIMQSFPIFDMRDNSGTPAANPPELAFLSQILGATLPAACQKSPTPTGMGEHNELDVPRRTLLHQNVPNPFNPATQIRFDLAQSGEVRLRIYDVAGRLVRTLIDKEMTVGWNHHVVWNGLDDHNQRVASGVYFYRLEAVGSSLTKKMVVMK